MTGGPAMIIAGLASLAGTGALLLALDGAMIAGAARERRLRRTGTPRPFSAPPSPGLRAGALWAVLAALAFAATGFCLSRIAGVAP